MNEKTMQELQSMGLSERIGQTLCFGWQGEAGEEARTLNAHARALVEEMRVGGIVLMGRNVNADAPDSTRALLAELQALSAVPLFMAIDQEGGRVNRLKAPFHPFPGNMALGAAGQPDLAYRQAQAQARELRALGINWNFAPVVDVNNNPDNPIIGVRSYGEAPTLVARMGAAAVQGYQEAGMLACAKHFPGHGDTAIDSHRALPTIPGNRARLDTVELVPFRAVIEAGVGAIMTTHILFPALDASRPATLSPAILTGLLRRELGYDGLVITDCLEMKAIADTVGTPRGAVEALKAGADMVLVCHTLETQRATVAALTDAVRSGDLPEARLNEAAGRVLTARRTFLAPKAQCLTPDANSPWLDPSHDALEREIARASVTVLYRPGGKRLPLNPDRPVTLLAYPPDRDDLIEALNQYARAGLYAPALERSPGTKSVSDILAGIGDPKDAQVILALSPATTSQNQRHHRRQETLLGRALGNELIPVALQSPYDLRRFPQAGTALCTYGDSPAQLAALAAALYGEYEPTGRLPVTIPGMER